MQEMLSKIYSGWNNIRKLYLNDALYLASVRVAFVMLQILILKITVHYLSNYELGIYAFLSAVSYSLNAFLLVPLDYYQQAQIYPLLSGKCSLRSIAILNRDILGILIAIVVALSVILSFEYPVISGMVALTGAFSIMIYLTTALRSLINNLEYRNVAASLLLAEGVVRIVSILIVFKLLIPTGSTLLIANIIALCFSLLFLGYFAVKLGIFADGPIKKYSVHEVATFGWPISLSTTLNWLQNQGYKMMLVPLGLTEISGIYSTVSGIGASGMTAVSSIYAGLFTPDLYKTNALSLRKYIGNALIVIGFVLLVALVFSNQIVAVLTKQEFVKYSLLILFGVVAEGCTLISGGVGVAFSVRNQMHALPWAALSGMLCMWIIFGVLYLFGTLNVWSLGIPLVVSQIVGVLYLKMLHSRQSESGVLQLDNA